MSCLYDLKEDSRSSPVRVIVSLLGSSVLKFPKVFNLPNFLILPLQCKCFIPRVVSYTHSAMRVSIGGCCEDSETIVSEFCGVSDFSFVACTISVCAVKGQRVHRTIIVSDNVYLSRKNRERISLADIVHSPSMPASQRSWMGVRAEIKRVPFIVNSLYYSLFSPAVSLIIDVDGTVQRPELSGTIYSDADHIAGLRSSEVSHFFSDNRNNTIVSFDLNGVLSDGHHHMFFWVPLLMGLLQSIGVVTCIYTSYGRRLSSDLTSLPTTIFMRQHCLPRGSHEHRLRVDKGSQMIFTPCHNELIIVDDSPTKWDVLFNDSSYHSNIFFVPVIPFESQTSIEEKRLEVTGSLTKTSITVRREYPFPTWVGDLFKRLMTNDGLSISNDLLHEFKSINSFGNLLRLSVLVDLSSDSSVIYPDIVNVALSTRTKMYDVILSSTNRRLVETQMDSEWKAYLRVVRACKSDT